MNEQLALVVRLRTKENVRILVRDSLAQIFGLIQDESTFVSATIHEDLEDPEELLVYEVWEETRESFLANQMSKPYHSKYEKVILDLDVKRTGQWLKPAGSWRHLS